MASPSTETPIREVPIPIAAVSLATMDLRNPATLGSLSNSIVQPSLSRPLKNFYRGEPMALGITQILIGILETAFGLLSAIVRPPYYYSDHVSTPYWLAFLYIISGSLSVAAAKNPKLPLVKGMLGMNIMSAVTAGIVILMLTLLSDYLVYYSPDYYYRNDDLPTELYHEVEISQKVMHGIWVILLVFTIVEFLIAITSAVFGCATLCRNTYSETTVVIFQNTAGPEGPPVVPASEKEDEVP